MLSQRIKYSKHSTRVEMHQDYCKGLMKYSTISNPENNRVWHYEYIFITQYGSKILVSDIISYNHFNK